MIIAKFSEDMYSQPYSRDWRSLIVFQQLIVLCDADGVIDMTPDALSRRTSIPLPHVEVGLKLLEECGSIFCTCARRGIGWKVRSIENYKRHDSGRPPQSEWDQTRAYIFERDNYTCTYCQEKDGDLHCDHIQPVALGGSSDYENLTTACAFCNMSKGKKTLKAWNEWRASR